MDPTLAMMRYVHTAQYTQQEYIVRLFFRCSHTSGNLVMGMLECLEKQPHCYSL